MRPLTLLQRQRITLSLFFTVAVGAVFTVATPAFVPWQVVDDKRAQALDQQRRQGKDFHIVANRRRSNGGMRNDVDEEQDTSNTASEPSSTVSSQGPLISLLTDRTKYGDSLSSAANNSSGSSTISEVLPQDPSDPTAPTKKRRRRRKRKMVNEGWQELTGRTAREEKERQHVHTGSSIPDARVPGENGGIEISWKNKAKS